MLRPLLTTQASTALDSRGARRALVSGWANEWVRGAARTRLVDPLTGLVTPAVLARRMHEVLQRNEQEPFVGIGAVPAACVVIVDLFIEDSRSLHATAALCRAAAAVATVFHSGQTIARLGSRIVVLALDPAAVEAHSDEVLDAFAADPLLADLPAMAWVEQIPTDRTVVERFVADLYPSDEPVRLAG
jgi:GGDEF domain-containing protein